MQKRKSFVLISAFVIPSVCVYICLTTTVTRLYRLVTRLGYKGRATYELLFISVRFKMVVIFRIFFMVTGIERGLMHTELLVITLLTHIFKREAYRVQTNTITCSRVKQLGYQFCKENPFMIQNINILLLFIVFHNKYCLLNSRSTYVELG